MARARIVKPELFRNEDLAELPVLARYLFIGLWTIADSKGRLEDRPRRIKADLFPYEDNLAEVEQAMLLLDQRGFIKRYEVDGQPLVEIPKFLKHQKPHPRETESVLPGSGSPKASPRRTQGTPRLPVSVSVSVSDPVREACGEPSASPQASSADEDLSVAEYGLVPEKPQSAIISLPCTGMGGREYAVTDAQVARWSEAFPGVDVLAELRKAREWLEANRAKRKTHRGIPVFVVRWLTRAQDQPRRNGGSGSATGSDPPAAQAFDPGFYDRQAEEFAREHARRTAQPRNGT